jgi:HTH-type transcriptional regulator, sugar sensing transcriptional regulator
MYTRLLNKLQESGLTKREAHIYLALLQKKEFAASELASIIPVGRTKVYEIIPNLIAKGLCTEIQKDGKKIYCAVEPKVALQSLLTFFKQKVEDEIAKKEEEITKKQDMFNRLENDLDEIYTINLNNSASLDYIEVLKDRNQIRKRWIELQKSTKKEMLGFNKPPYSMPYNENMKHQGKMMKRKSIISQGIYEYGELFSGTISTDFLPVFEYYQSLGEECRIIKKLPMKLMIMDEKITMLALNDPVSMQPSITTMIIKHPSFALAQKEVFESYWQKAVPLDIFKKSKNVKY